MQHHAYTASIPLHAAPLNLRATLFCGQAFRWIELPASDPNAAYFQAVVSGEVLQLSVHHEVLYAACTSSSIEGEPLADFVNKYLGLSRAMDNVFQPSFQKKFPEVYRGAMRYAGLRLLQQAPFETLISFMCAQGVGIALIRRQVAELATHFGKLLHTELGEPTYAFPTPDALASANRNTLIRCANNNGIRAKNIRAVSKAVALGELNLNNLLSPTCSYLDARNALVTYNGIGQKIADCVCAFGFGHREAFPIDTHVRQYLQQWFRLRSRTVSLTPKEYDRLCDRARHLIGDANPALAGQWLFHYWRKDVKGMTAF
jgi:N-glycosylase/DNA lyase